MAARVWLSVAHWSGQFAVDFTLANLHSYCTVLADKLATSGRSCLLAYDTRFLSQTFARDLRRLLAERGVATLIAAAPSTIPAIRCGLAQGKADCALVVSAGNMPYWYNGLILLSRHADLALPADVVAEAALPVAGDRFPPPPLDERDPSTLDLRAAYLDSLRSQVDVELIRRASMTIFVDAMNGSSAGYLPAIIGDGQTKAIEINREPDPLFGRMAPHPAENGLARLRKLVRESDSHVGMAIAADGTALAVTDSAGNLIDGNRLLVLLATYLQSEHRLRGTIIAPEQGRAVVAPYEQQLGLKVEYADDAPQAVAAALQNERGGLLAAHIGAGCFYVGRPVPEADAVLAALLLIEMSARSGRRLGTLIDELDDRAS